MNARNAGIGADLDLPAAVTQRSNGSTTAVDLPVAADLDALAKVARPYTTVEEDV